MSIRVVGTTDEDLVTGPHSVLISLDAQEYLGPLGLEVSQDQGWRPELNSPARPT